MGAKEQCSNTAAASREIECSFMSDFLKVGLMTVVRLILWRHTSSPECGCIITVFKLTREKGPFLAISCSVSHVIT